MRSTKNMVAAIYSIAGFLLFNGCQCNNPVASEKEPVLTPIHKCKIINSNDSLLIYTWVFSIDTINHVNDTFFRDTLLPGEESESFEMKSNGFYRVGAFWVYTFYDALWVPSHGVAWVEAPIWPLETDPLNYKIYFKGNKITVQK